MLLAVEGGGFFSASASGYSKGLTLLLLGHKSEEQPMRVAPWNQYQLVDQETDLDLLASGKNRLVRGCSSFVCFGRGAAGLESPSPLKVGPIQQQVVLPEPTVSDKEKDDTHNIDLVDNDIITKKVDLKSSLKKTTTSIPVFRAVTTESEALSENGSNVPSHTERRRVKWTDVYGGELVEVREFEGRYGTFIF